VESVAAVFFSHPDESNIVEKIIATNVDRNVVFMGLTRVVPNFGPNSNTDADLRIAENAPPE
jgi:hypothetical protein